MNRKSSNQVIFPGFLLLLLLILFIPSQSKGASLSLDPLQGEIRPGNAVLIGFDVPESGKASLVLKADEDSEELLSIVALDMDVRQGRNGVWWNGTYNGQMAPEGDALLFLVQGTQTACTPVHIGPVYPMVIPVVTQRATTIGTPMMLTYEVSCEGEVSFVARQGEKEMERARMRTKAGKINLAFDGTDMEEGDVTLIVRLTDREGASAASELLVHLSAPEDEEETVYELPVTEVVIEEEVIIPADEPTVVINDQRQYTPAYSSPYDGQDGTMNYWTMPMDITDEDAVWQMLISPVTVVDTGKKNAEKTQVVIRAEPSEKAGGVGVVTCVTQSVHVLETLDNGWSLIECYSSSFHDSKIKAWNMLVQGYVQTSLLKTAYPDQEMGLVVDKLTQRMYIFREGHLFSTLLVSTGLANARQPYNETRSGEFLLQIPAVGDFKSDNLTCSMGIRFNDGDLIHEVPHMKNRDGSKNYSTTEYKLGNRGSHGCIRVQRKQTPEGTNMYWLWKNKRKNMKIVIWEDWQGRQISYPSDETVVYINPEKAKTFHSHETCNSEKNVVLQPITYGELESDDYKRLTRCEYCTPVMTKAEIDAINEAHAPGGDHDPVLTEARAKQPKVQ